MDPWCCAADAYRWALGGVAAGGPPGGRLAGGAALWEETLPTVGWCSIARNHIGLHPVIDFISHTTCRLLVN